MRGHRWRPVLAATLTLFSVSCMIPELPNETRER